MLRFYSPGAIAKSSFLLSSLSILGERVRGRGGKNF
jgi:hypothetical protein